MLMIDSIANLSSPFCCGVCLIVCLCLVGYDASIWYFVVDVVVAVVVFVDVVVAVAFAVALGLVAPSLNE